MQRTSAGAGGHHPHRQGRRGCGCCENNQQHTVTVELYCSENIFQLNKITLKLSL